MPKRPNVWRTRSIDPVPGQIRKCTPYTARSRLRAVEPEAIAPDVTIEARIVADPVACIERLSNHEDTNRREVIAGSTGSFWSAFRTPGRAVKLART